MRPRKAASWPAGPRRRRNLAGRSGHDLAIKSAVGGDDREPSLAKQSGGRPGIQIRWPSSSAQQIPPISELLHRGQVQQDSARQLAERQPDRIGHGAVTPERYDSDPDALLIRGREIPGHVVRFGDTTIPVNGGCPPRSRWPGRPGGPDPMGIPSVTIPSRALRVQPYRPRGRGKESLRTLVIRAQPLAAASGR